MVFGHRMELVPFDTSRFQLGRSRARASALSLRGTTSPARSNPTRPGHVPCDTFVGGEGVRITAKPGIRCSRRNRAKGIAATEEVVASGEGVGKDAFGFLRDAVEAAGPSRRSTARRRGSRWCWTMARSGSGTSPRSCSRAQWRSWTFGTLGSICGKWPGRSTTSARRCAGRGRRAASTDDVLSALRKHDGSDEARRSRVRRGQSLLDALPGVPRRRGAVGSGVVESACDTVAGRLRRGGMHWSVDGGANLILTLRCWWLDGRYDGFFKARAKPLPIALAA